jgi:hypothetical protein
MRHVLIRAAFAGVLATSVLAWPSSSFAQIDVSLTASIAPPPIPVYEQPVLAGPGDIWMPGYWSYGPDGYFWVPGTWVLPPAPGLLWTPGYWGWNDGAYGWHAGYWGPQVGFYGGVNYGFGYTGTGYQGGYWDHGRLFYNRAANNMGSVQVTNVFDKPVQNGTSNHVSFNGGSGGTQARPTAEEESAAHERHTPPTALQTQHEHAAAGDKSLFANVNHGHPDVAATSRPADLQNRGVQPGQAATGPRGQEPAQTTEQRQPAEHAAPAQSPVREAAPLVAPSHPAEPPHAAVRPVQERPSAQTESRPPAQAPVERAQPPVRQAAPLVAPSHAPAKPPAPQAAHAPAPAAKAPAPAHPQPAAHAPEHDDHH